MALRKRNLPHFQEADAVYFVTFRRKAEVDVDLTGAAAAEAIVGALRYFAGVRYRLYDYTVMSDHVHVILQPLARDGQFEPLHKIMHTALRAGQRTRSIEPWGVAGACGSTKAMTMYCEVPATTGRRRATFGAIQSRQA